MIVDALDGIAHLIQKLEADADKTIDRPSSAADDSEIEEDFSEIVLETQVLRVIVSRFPLPTTALAVSNFENKIRRGGCTTTELHILAQNLHGTFRHELSKVGIYPILGPFSDFPGEEAFRFSPSVLRAFPSM